MKTKKAKAVKLLPTKLGKKQKDKKMSQFNFDNLADMTMKPPPPVKRKRKNIPYTPAEDQQLVEACKHNAPEGKCTKDFLEALAKHLNIKFHESKKQRTSESLWWHINREQKKGNTYFAGISISGSSPDKNKGPQKPKTKGAGQVIDSALKQPKPVSVKSPLNLLPPTKVKNSKTSGGSLELDVLLRDPLTGETSRFKTKKFETIEEAMFAIT